MKRILSLLVVLCLAMSICSVASAAVTITKQPETQTVKVGGTASFQVKAKNASGQAVTWYFTNPATGEVTTGKKLASVVSGVKVSNPNSLKITLKKIPEAMHGWSVYCHIGPKSGGVNTNSVMILIAGKETPASTPVPAPVSGSDSGSDSSSGKSSGKTSSGSATESEVVYVTPEPAGPVVIKASGKTELYELDRKGAQIGGAKTEITFPAGESANFYVKIPEGTEGTIQYITVNSVRLTPEGDVTGMSVRGWDESATVKIKLKSDKEQATREPKVYEDVDESQLVTVTCTNCRFTGWKSSFAESGQVPIGTTITVVASGGQIQRGYSINGAKADYKGQASFKLVINEDTTISMEKQK